MRVVERGITSSKRCSCWHAARDGAPWEAAFRYERLVAGKEDGPGGRDGQERRLGVAVRGGTAGMPSVMNPLLGACAYRDGEHGASVTRQGRAGRVSRPSRWPGSRGGIGRRRSP